jgi:hypothetical protein
MFMGESEKSLKSLWSHYRAIRLSSTGSQELCYARIVPTLVKKLITKFLNAVRLHHFSKRAFTLLGDLRYISPDG